MRTTLIADSALLVILAAPLAAAAPQSRPASGPSAPVKTTNDFTPEQEQHARDAAARAGFVVAPRSGWAQAGYMFFNATKGEKRYGLTIAPDGAVYASNGIPISEAPR